MSKRQQRKLDKQQRRKNKPHMCIDDVYMDAMLTGETLFSSYDPATNPPSITIFDHKGQIKWPLAEGKE